MFIYSSKNNIYDAVDSIVDNGIVAIDGTKTTATQHANKIMDCLEAYGIESCVGYQNVINNGYLYYVYDVNNLNLTNCSEIKNIINEIDKTNSI